MLSSPKQNIESMNMPTPFLKFVILRINCKKGYNRTPKKKPAK